MHQFRLETRRAVEAVERALHLTAPGALVGELAPKGDRDLVTAADIAVEEDLRRALVNGTGFAVIGEERGGEVPDDGSPYWLVDPICGTRNFASGIRLFSVNLALVEGGRVVASVVGDASSGEIALAELGAGAWAMQDGSLHRLTASDESRTVVVEDGRAAGERREHAARFAAALMRADRWDFRSLGSTLGLPWVAAGKVAAYIVFWVPALHTAAGSLLVTEAGGYLSDVHGEPWTLASDSIVASGASALYADLQSLIHEARP